ncbi:hypothetical protein ACSTHX_00390, partial [Vibrio parahaemolyticus]
MSGVNGVIMIWSSQPRLFVAAAALAWSCVVTSPARAEVPTLRPVVTVNAADLRIGDLFSG